MIRVRPMLVPEFYWQCSAFLCQENSAGERVPRGTAFLVSVPTGTLACYTEVLYIVTVGHNVQMARANDRPTYLRLNRKDESTEDIKLDLAEGAWAESSETDLAVSRLQRPSLGDYEATRLLPEQLASDDAVAEWEVGPGDEVFFCGLFTEHPGRERSQPIVRWGNVSMMPGEKVRVGTPDGGTRLIDAYLVEARSWGGQSGSPAFVFFPPDRHLGFIEMPSWSEGDPGKGGRLRTKDMPLLLGVVQGHFDIHQDVAFKAGFDDEASVPVNAGIAVVIPAQKIVDLLLEPELVRARNEIAGKLAENEPAASMDFSSSAEERPADFERFEDLTRKLVNVPKKELDEKRKEEES